MHSIPSVATILLLSRIVLLHWSIMCMNGERSRPEVLRKIGMENEMECIRILRGIGFPLAIKNKDLKVQLGNQ